MGFRRERVQRALLASFSARPDRLALLPLKNAVLLPSKVLPVNVGRPRSLRLAEWAKELGPIEVGVVAQHDPTVEEPTFGDLRPVGTIARVIKVIRLGPVNMSMVPEGVGRFRVVDTAGSEPFFRAKVERLVDAQALPTTDELTQLRERGREAGSRGKLDPATVAALERGCSDAEVADIVAAGILGASREDLLDVLDALDRRERARRVTRLLDELRTLPPPPLSEA